MKYCIDWRGQDLKVFQSVDEINIDLKKIKHLTKEDLNAFCEKYKKRINLCINDNDSIHLLQFAFDYAENTSNNVSIRLPEINDDYIKIINEKKDKHLKIFFNVYVNNWDELYHQMSLNVSDIYLTEAMGFELNKVISIAHEKGIQIRAFPNVVQGAWEDLDDLKKFWIRPEDISIYEPYIDICEFYGDQGKAPLYYEIYAKDKKWMGNLNEIILGMKQDINSGCLIPRFAQKRINCNRECMKGGSCRMCDTIVELSKNLDESELKIIYKEDKQNGERTKE